MVHSLPHVRLNAIYVRPLAMDYLALQVAEAVSYRRCKLHKRLGMVSRIASQAGFLHHGKEDDAKIQLSNKTVYQSGDIFLSGINAGRGFSVSYYGCPTAP